MQRRLEQVAGVSRVVSKGTKAGHLCFEIESLQGRHVRPDVARAVVESDWNLHSLHQETFSLEEVFLQLTSTDAPKEAAQ